MIAGASLYAAATEYVGVPFRHKGRSRAGLDCAGLVFVACRDCGIVLPECLAYGPVPATGALLTATGERAKRVERAQAGDVMLMRYGRGGPTHFAIFDGHARIVHALEPARGVIVDPIAGAWSARLHSVWRINGVE